MSASGVPTYKLVVVGDGCTGKTTYINRHHSGAFERKYVPTVGVEISTLPFYTTQGEVHFEVHDTAGQEKFGGLRDAHYINSQACFLFFDVTSRVTYQNIENWYLDVVNICPDIPFVLIGNKCDVNNREMRAQAVTWHRKKSIPYVEMSAKSNFNYEVPFVLICRKLANDPNLELTQAPSLLPPEITLNAEQIQNMKDNMNLANNVALPTDD